MSLECDFGFGRLRSRRLRRGELWHAAARTTAAMGIRNEILRMMTPVPRGGQLPSPCPRVVPLPRGGPERPIRPVFSDAQATVRRPEMKCHKIDTTATSRRR
mgnify:CR=1 FL=1